MDSSVNAQISPPNRKRGWRFWLSWVAIATIGLVYMSGRLRPDHLGVRDGRLAPCPDSPNCVSTQGHGEHGIAPLRLKVEPGQALQTVTQRVAEWPRTKVVTQTKDYLHIECTSLLLRFVDDLEIWIDDQQRLVHARSASRVGYSDLGVNRDRVERLFEKLVETGVAER